MSDDPPPSASKKGLTGPRALAYGLTFLPPFVLYKLAESMAQGAGLGRWAAIGVGSLGAVLGGVLAGTLLYFVFVRKAQPKT